MTPKRKIKIEDDAHKAVAKFLNMKGWNPVVAQFTAIEQGERKHQYRLVYSFTGNKKSEAGNGGYKRA